MRNLIIEIDSAFAAVDDMFKLAIANRFQENREVWTDFKDAFHPTNIDRTIDRFLSLEYGDNIIFQDILPDLQQWHFFVNIFYMMMKKGISVTIYVLHPNLQSQFDKYQIMDKHELLDINFVKTMGYHPVYELGMTEALDKRVMIGTASEFLDEWRPKFDLTVDYVKPAIGSGRVVSMLQKPMAVLAFS